MTLWAKHTNSRYGKSGMHSALSVVALATAASLVAAPAHAYVGPGLGLGVIGTVIGVLAAVILTLFGLVWYPMKRMLGRKAAVAGDAPELDETDINPAANDRTD